MLRVKRILSLITLMIGVVVGILLFPCFSFGQNFGPMNGNLFDRMFRFSMLNTPVYLYAVTEPNTYTIYFDGNGSTSGNMGSMSMIYDKDANLLPNNFIKDGYAFLGWSTSAEGMVEYLDQSEIKNLTSEDLGEVTLYAQRVDAGVFYTVEYLLENVAGTGYDLVETGTMYGGVGTGIVLTGKMYTGFMLKTGIEINIVSSGTVQYYYTRNIYNLRIVDRNSILMNTGVKFGTKIDIPVYNLVWTGNTFSGWNNVPADGKMPASDLEITSIWSYGVHTIIFDTDGGTEIEPITGNYGEVVKTPKVPIKEGYEFVGWSPSFPETIPYDDIIIRAIWKEVAKNRGTGWSGRGRSRRLSDLSQGGNQHESAQNYNQLGSGILNEEMDLEVLFAYMWAHDMGIIDTVWEDSDPDGYITRGDMAEMVVKFTENVLGRKVPLVMPVECNWGDADLEWKSVGAKTYAKKACALGVMGIRMKDFKPNKLIDRAEFGTILSRLLWGDKYDVVNATAINPYYTRHLEALSREGIMRQIENPKDRKELKKWAWIMLMRVKL